MKLLPTKNDINYEDVNKIGKLNSTNICVLLEEGDKNVGQLSDDSPRYFTFSQKYFVPLQIKVIARIHSLFNGAMTLEIRAILKRQIKYVVPLQEKKIM